MPRRAGVERPRRPRTVRHQPERSLPRLDRNRFGRPLPGDGGDAGGDRAARQGPRRAAGLRRGGAGRPRRHRARVGAALRRARGGIRSDRRPGRASRQGLCCRRAQAFHRQPRHRPAARRRRGRQRRVDPGTAKRSAAASGRHCPRGGAGHRRARLSAGRGAGLLDPRPAWRGAGDRHALPRQAADRGVEVRPHRPDARRSAVGIESRLPRGGDRVSDAGGGAARRAGRTAWRGGRPPA